MLLLLLLSHFSRVRLCATPETAAHQAPHPWDAPGKNTGVGCHFLLQCMKVKSERDEEIKRKKTTLYMPLDSTVLEIRTNLGQTSYKNQRISPSFCLSCVELGSLRFAAKRVLMSSLHQSSSQRQSKTKPDNHPKG